MSRDKETDLVLEVVPPEVGHLKTAFLSPEISLVGLTKIAIRFFKLNKMTTKITQIEADTCGFEFRITFGVKILF